MEISVELLAVLMFATLVLLIPMGHPLAITLAAVATLFGLIDNGFNIPGLFILFANNTWGIFQNHTLTICTMRQTNWRTSLR